MGREGDRAVRPVRTRHGHATAGRWLLACLVAGCTPGPRGSADPARLDAAPQGVARLSAASTAADAPPPGPSSAPSAAGTAADSPTPSVPAPSGRPPRAFRACAPPSDAGAPQASTLHDVDWCNAVDTVFGTLRAGREEIHEYEDLGGAHDTHVFRLGQVAYGDLNADGRDEAVVVLDVEGYAAAGGGSRHSEVRVYRLSQGQPRRVASTVAGFEAEVTLDRGRITATWPSRAGAPCTTVLTLVGTRLDARSSPCAGP